MTPLSTLLKPTVARQSLKPRQNVRGFGPLPAGRMATNGSRSTASTLDRGFGPGQPFATPSGVMTRSSLWDAVSV